MSGVLKKIWGMVLLLIGLAYCGYRYHQWDAGVKAEAQREALKLATIRGMEPRRVLRLVVDLGTVGDSGAGEIDTSDATVKELFEMSPGLYSDLSNYGFRAQPIRILSFIAFDDDIKGDEDLKFRDQRLLAESAIRRIAIRLQIHDNDNPDVDGQIAKIRKALEAREVVMPDWSHKTGRDHAGRIYRVLQGAARPDPVLFEAALASK